jgi:hypothetical protein
MIAYAEMSIPSEEQPAVRLSDGGDVAALVAERDKLTATIAEAAKAHAEMATELDAVRGELAKAQGELRNPAIKAANIVETTSAPSGDAGGAIKTKAQLEAAYSAIPGDTLEGAAAREAFRTQHKDALGL